MTAIPTIRVNGQLVPDGVINRMRRMMAEDKMRRIEAAEKLVSDRKTLRLLSRAWWKEWFSLNGEDSSSGIGRAA